MLQIDSTVVVTKDQVSCEMGEETVILDLTDGEYFELNDVGARIWEMIQQPCRLRDIEDALMEEYEVARELLRADILELVQEIVDKGLARAES